MKMRFSNVIPFLAALSTVRGATWIAPGAVWYDTSGAKIDAHGGGIVKRGDTFYWVGQSASNSGSPGPSNCMPYADCCERRNTLDVFLDRPPQLDESRKA